MAAERQSQARRQLATTRYSRPSLTGDPAVDLDLACAQQRALEMIAGGSALHDTLDYIVRSIEEHAPGMRGSVVLLPDGVHLKTSAAPELPREYLAEFDGLPIGPLAGSCGTAMHADQRVVVSDITTDERWTPYPEVVRAALAAGLRACWSTPLHDSTGRVIGSFAMYYGERRQPTHRDLALADAASHLAALAVQHEFDHRQLCRRHAEQTAVAQLGELALRGDDTEELMRVLAQRVVDALGGGCAALFEHRDGGSELRASAGWPTSDERPGAFPITVEVPGPGSGWGTLAVEPPTGAPWGDDEAAFLRSAVNVLAAALERSRQESTMRHRALHDPLTGLPNRDLLMSLLQHELESERRRGGIVGVLLVDLDNFKLINDSLGHMAGDDLLAQLAPRLQRVLRESDTVARFGGDEFVIVAATLQGEAEVVTLAERVAGAVGEPFQLGGGAHHVSASIGIALSPGGRGDPERLLRDADAAMYHAKRSGGAAHKIFDAGMNERALGRLQLVSALRAAHEAAELTVVYQPIVWVSGGRMAGAEALLRWDTEAGRPHAVADVIAAAEESGLIRPVGAWVLTQTLAHISQDGPPGEAWISVNLSARHLAAGDVAGLVARLLAERDVSPDRLVLEITETALLDDTGASLGAIHDLQGLGVRLALDDFGTGFSSLGHLLRFPIDILKIDRAFVAGLPGDTRARAIVSGVTVMAHELGKLVVAEGVESARQLAEVQELGCDLAQGWWLGRPAAYRELMVSRPA